MLFSEHYGELKALQACRYPIANVGSVLSVIQDGLHGIRRYVPEGVALLGVGNVTEDGIDLSQVNCISAEEHDRLVSSQVKRGDLLVTITGRLGTASLYDSDALANLSAHVALCRPNPDFDLLYLKHFFASRFGAASFSKAQIGSTHPHINVRRLAELPLPLPPLATQRELAEGMESARELRRAKLTEADALLSSLDDYLLDKLGLAHPPTDARRTFAVRLGTINASRFDPDYFHPERILTVRDMQTRAGLMRNAPLQTVVDFQRDPLTSPGDNYLSLAHVQSHTGELAESDETATGACFVFRSGDVLFGRLRPYLNKVHRAERDGCCSPEFHVMRVRPGADLQPDYLAAILRSSLTLAQTRHMMTGNTHPRLATDDVVNLVVPIPDMTVQMAIAAEVQRRRELARRLRAEAEAGWSEAKRWFEEQLLGPAP